MNVSATSVVSMISSLRLELTGSSIKRSSSFSWSQSLMGDPQLLGCLCLRPCVVVEEVSAGCEGYKYQRHSSFNGEKLHNYSLLYHAVQSCVYMYVRM